MDITLDYQHNSNNIYISFNLYNGEVGFAVGFGKTCEEAEQNIKGWFDKNSKFTGRRLLYEKDKPFIVLKKKMADGKVIKTDKCINILENMPTGGPNQITIRPVHF